MIEIRDRWDGSVRHTVDAPTVRAAVLVLIAQAAEKEERADLSDADLSRANLSHARVDFLSIIDALPAEVPGLLARIRAGTVDGSTYERGGCSCLLGSLAAAREERTGTTCDYSMLSVTPDANRPAERLFLAIRPGDTPERNPVARIVEGWIMEWMTARETAPAAEG